jgi:hypothetical protein
MLPGFQLFLLEQNLVRLSLSPPLNHDGVYLNLFSQATVIGLLRQINELITVPYP